jgi:UDP-N-acetylmuramoylalanine--D-glutamate ligase
VITAGAWKNKRYAVYGLARSGLATVRALVASGAEVTAWDDREEARAQAEGATLLDLHAADLSRFDSLVVSPGVPLNTHPLAKRAGAAGVEIIGDIELFARARAELPPHKVVGITGTNGKSTTTALVHHILKTAGVPTTMGGNIGLPTLAQDALPEGGVYVLELSSYQIDLTQSLDCDVAVVLNVTPDHLDRYECFVAYRKAKERLLWMSAPGTGCTWYFYLRQSPLRSLHSDGDVSDIMSGRSVWSTFRIRGRSLPNDVHTDESLGQAERWWLGPSLQQEEWPSLQGPHNLENANAAIIMTKALDVSDVAVDHGLSTYPGLPHRMERVRELNGVLFVNDSKATNPEAAAPALAAYPRIRWIVGGQAKTKELGDTAKYLDHVVRAYTIGEAGSLFTSLLRERGVDVIESETLENAVKSSARDSQAGEVVLLSPACASFDQFRDFEARGEAFKALVGAL